jgi:hypothetical protein
MTTTLLSPAVGGGGTSIEERDSDAEKVARIKLEREATTALAAANRFKLLDQLILKKHALCARGGERRGSPTALGPLGPVE